MNWQEQQQDERAALASAIEDAVVIRAQAARIGELERAIRAILAVDEPVENYYECEPQLTEEMQDAIDAARAALERPAREAAEREASEMHAAMWRRAEERMANEPF